jgi:hypothetical protein
MKGKGQMLWISHQNELLAVNAIRLVLRQVAHFNGYDMVAFVTDENGEVAGFIVDRDENILELRNRLFDLQDRLVKKGTVILPAGYGQA